MNDTNIRNTGVITICIKLAIFTTSFDIFGVINIAGFNFRITQLAIIPCFIMLFLSSKNKKIIHPHGILYLILWFILQAVFSFRSPSLKNAIGYDLWLAFDILVIYSIVNLCDDEISFKWLLKTYIDSFCFMGIIGLIQMFLYALGIHFYITQHFTDKIGRINGFSYEPSYYATYMIMGFVICSYLLLKDNLDVYERIQLQNRQRIIALALILSTSRMGWLMICLWIFIKIVIRAYEFLNNGVSKSTVLLVFLFIIALPVLYSALPKMAGAFDFSIFLNGLGIGGKATHSSSARINGLNTCLEIFKDSPICGYGLGGVDPIIAERRGIVYSTLNNGAAMSIVGEILVAGGAIGTFLFIIYLFLILRFIKGNDVHNALVLALVFELIILCFNQNILRPYLWMHISILCSSFVLTENKCSMGIEKRREDC